MSFFLRKKAKGVKQKGGAVKRSAPHMTEPKLKKKKQTSEDDEEIPSDSDFESDGEVERRGNDEFESSESEDETAAEKRLRLAKQYLAKIAQEEAENESGEETEEVDVIGRRLQKDVLAETGRLQRDISQYYVPPSSSDIQMCRGHKLPVTCIAISSDNKTIFSASKDCSIVKWELSSQKKLKTIPGGRKGTEDKHKGHTSHVLCMAICSDNKFLVSGDQNKLIHVWNPDTCELLHTFRGHREAVSGLAFRKGTHQLFSSSHDKTVKVWNLDEMAYVETLFGHEDVITCVDSLSRERAITSGGRDGSVRIWKVLEESQLVFHGHRGSIDSVSLINEENFISGADDNSLALWSVMKKKPLVTVNKAHGRKEDGKVSDSENWITAVVSLQHTDLVASGSKDGAIRLWRCGPEFKSLHPLFTIPVSGFVNGLKFTSDGQYLVAAVGQEHRLGRWWRLKEAKNGICIIKLTRKEAEKTKPKQNVNKDS